MLRLKLPVVAHVFLTRDGAVLLARRSGTGVEDGNYGPVGGHLEPGESVVQAAVRECREEVGVNFVTSAVRPLGVTHYTSPTGDGIDFFLEATQWVGEPTATAECDDLRWCRLDTLPPNTIPFVRRALELPLVGGVWFDESGWDAATM